MAEKVPVLWPWQGGKARLAPWIANRLPPHRVYVEPFAGTAAVLLAKVPSPIEVLNDANGDIIAVYRCLQDPGLSRQLWRRIRWTPVSRAEWIKAHEPPDESDLVEQAARFLVRMLQGFGGKPNASAWGGGVGDDIHLRINRFLHRLRPVADRLQAVVLETGDWATVVTRYEREDTVVYCDPPYLTATDHNTYTMGSWTETEQDRLIAWALHTPAMVILSGYDHPIYDALRQAGWHQEFRRLSVSVLGRTRASRLAGGHLDPETHYRQDCVWWSPSAWQQARRQLNWFDDASVEEQ